jgi:hypothetical protein
MPELILHGGAGKTGTSLLQVMFARYAETMAAEGVIYPEGHLFDEAKAGMVTSGNGVEMANYIRPHLPHAIPDKDTFLGRFEAELSAAEGKHVLYSSEFLLIPPSERTSALLSVARALGYRARYIFFVRDIAPAIISAYSQRVKRAGETRPLSEFLREWNPNYWDTVQQASSVVGFENVEVYNYEEHRAHLAEFFFRDVLRLGFAPEEAPIVNRSLSAKEIAIKRRQNTKLSDPLSDSATSGLTTNPEELRITALELDFLATKFQAAVENINSLVRGRATKIADIS